MLLVIITFFTSIQYVFLAGVPENISGLSFMFITSLIGFFILLVVFFNELFRLDKSHIMQSLILAIEIFVFNFFLLLGVNGVDATVVSSILSSYFVFIPIAEYFMYKSLPKTNTIIAIIISLIGVILIIGLNFNNIFNSNVLFLILADISMALYVITTGSFAKNSNPAVISMGQLFFVTIFAFIGWCIEVHFKGLGFKVPKEPLFWGSVIFISFFIRGLYTVIQVYAQRYVSPINTSLIFASEIVMTLFLSASISNYFGFRQEMESITLVKCVGAVLMVLAILICDNNFYELIKRKLGIKV